MNKKFIALLSVLLMFMTSVYGADSKVKFDNKTYNLSNPETKSDKYVYLLKNENIGNWTSKVYKEYMKDVQNPTEAAAEEAYRIQKENPKAVVLVYPKVATLGYITFPENKQYYEYNCIVFKPDKTGINRIGYTRRFYSSSNGGENGARTAAILFAEKYNKKYMEMINRLSIK